MRVIYRDLQESASAFNGAELTRPEEVRTLFAQLRGRKAFMFELVGENGYKLVVGRGEECGCAQFSPADGAPPYFMAVSQDIVTTEEFVEFLAGDTPTPIPQRFCLPLSMTEDIASEFVRQGTRSTLNSWEEI